jgi:O-antigen ligase
MASLKINDATEGKLINLIVSVVVAVTVSLTPWVNSDSLIIPKVIILFCSAMFLLPKFLTNFRPFYKSIDPLLKMSYFVVLCFMCFMILVMSVSKAPFEQEFYGRTGRGLGLATYLSLAVVLLVSSRYALLSKVNVVHFGLVFSCVISSSYSILQRHGLDIFDWVTYTNGIIGTLGNPNFQSSFAAMALVSSLVFLGKSKKQILITLLILILLIYTLYITQSTQGYIATALSISVFMLIFLWYQKKVFFIGFFTFFIVSSFFAIIGMLDRGPLNYFLYKTSVQSRGEMWRTGISAANDNPIFGVGLDSYGDYSLLYRDEKTVNGINEFTDNAHNIFIQTAATGGYILAFIYLLIVGLTLYSFILLQKKLGKFNRGVAALFSAWIAFQAQSLISPPNISMLAWNFLISGFLIGIGFQKTIETNSFSLKDQGFSRPIGYLFLIFSLVVMYPMYNADKIAWSTKKTGDALVAIKAAKMYPESSLRYFRIGMELYNSKLLEASLDIGRSAVKFNPNAVSAWFLILINETAPIEERRIAREQIVRLDPLGTDVDNFRF